MDIHSEVADPRTPGLTFDSNSSYWKREDSGYHTSFTPGSLECSEITSDSSVGSLIQGRICFSGPYQVDCFNISPDIDLISNTKYNSFSASIRNNDCFKESPIFRRGVKRPHPEEIENNDISFGSMPTPTTLIAGGLKKLKFYDGTKPKPRSLGCNESFHEFHNHHDIDNTFPSTPVKKSCRKNCQLNSPTSRKRSAHKLNFTMHSLSCEAKALQPVVKVTESNTVKSIQFRLEQKIDIIKMLSEKVNSTPPLTKIFSYLTNEDIFNFTLVSPVWRRVWADISRSRERSEYRTFLKNAKENVENKEVKPKHHGPLHTKPLMETNNIIVPKTPVGNSGSPPGTPRTIKFKRFVKAASQDVRKQASCVRCHRPAKVTEEAGGDDWVECTSANCAYRYCKFCMSDRHPGKKCFRYDLNGPSPTKRKKASAGIGTKKSRKNLRRLL